MKLPSGLFSVFKRHSKDKDPSPPTTISLPIKELEVCVRLTVKDYQEPYHSNQQIGEKWVHMAHTLERLAQDHPRLNLQHMGAYTKAVLEIGEATHALEEDADHVAVPFDVMENLQRGTGEVRLLKYAVLQKARQPTTTHHTGENVVNLHVFNGRSAENIRREAASIGDFSYVVGQRFGQYERPRTTRDHILDEMF